MNEKYVLLVEVNPDDVTFVQIAFQRSGIDNELKVVQDGQEALDFLFGEGKYADRDTTQTPAVVLLDLKLPYVSGLDVLKQVRMNTDISRLPVVVLSSTVNRQEIDECERLGINRYYRKPDSFEELRKIIEEIRRSFLEPDRIRKRI